MAARCSARAEEHERAEHGQSYGAHEHRGCALVEEIGGVLDRVWYLDLFTPVHPPLE